jgi:hypothetical protein
LQDNWASQRNPTLLLKAIVLLKRHLQELPLVKAMEPLKVKVVPNNF